MQSQLWRYVKCVASTSKAIIYENALASSSSCLRLRHYATVQSISKHEQQTQSDTIRDELTAFNTIHKRDEAHSQNDSHADHLKYLDILNSVEDVEFTKGKSLDRIQAYMRLRNQAPHLMASLSDQGVLVLCNEAIDQGLWHILHEILRDIKGHLYHSPKGSLDRCNTICSVIASLYASERRDDLMTDSNKSFEDQEALIRQRWTQSKGFLCRLLIDELDVIKETNSENVVKSETLQNLDNITAGELLLTIITIDQDQEMLSFVFALLDHIQSRFNLRSYLGHVHLSDQLVRYLLRSSVDTNIDMLMKEISIYHASNIASELVDGLKMDSWSTDTDFQLFSKERLHNLIGNYGDRLSEFDQSKLKERMQIRSSIATSAVQAGLYSVAMKDLSEMLNDLIGAIPLQSAPLFECELVFLQGIRFVFRSMANQNTTSQKDHQMICKFLPILIRHSLLDPHSDDLLWLRDYGHRMLGLENHEIFIKVLTLSIQEIENLTRNKLGVFDVMSLLGGELMMLMIERIGQSGDSVGLRQFLTQMRLMAEDGRTGDDRIDLIFTETLRVRLIVACASCELNGYAIALYKRWADDREKGEITFELIGKRLSEITRESRQGSGIPIASVVSMSSQCMGSVVHILTRGTRFDWHKNVAQWNSYESGENIITDVSFEEIPLSIKFAYKALFSFFNAKEFNFWNEKDFINVAHALYRLGHPREAFYCISTIPDRKHSYGADLMAVLVRGLAESDLEKSVDHLEAWSKASETSDLINAKVIGPVIMQSLRQEKFELVKRLVDLTDSLDMTEDIAIGAVNVLAQSVLANRSRGLNDKEVLNNKIVDGFDYSDGSEVLLDESKSSQRWIRRIINDKAWSPKPSHLRQMIVLCIQESEKMLQANRKSNVIGPNNAIPDRMTRIATILLQYGNLKLKRVDHLAVMKILSSFHSDSTHIPAPQRASYRRQKINELDKVVTAIRWAIQYRIDLDESRLVKEILEEDDTLKKFQTNNASRINAAKIKSKLIPSNHSINILPPIAFRSLILAYLRLGDTLGAASVITWLRDECGLSLNDLSEGWKGNKFRKSLKSTIYSSRNARGPVDQVMRWISGQEKVPLIKPWWQEPRNEDVQ